MLLPQELRYQYDDPGGKGAFFPEEWDRFAAHVCTDAAEARQRGAWELVELYHKQVNQRDKRKARAAAVEWMRWSVLALLTWSPCNGWY